MALNIDRILEEALRSTPLFADLSVTGLSQALLTQQLQTAEILFNQGELNTDLYIIKEGAIKVVLADEYGRELLLKAYGPGELFGELALLSEQPRAATAVATSPTTHIKLTRDAFLQFLENTTGISLDSVEDFHRTLRQQYKIQLLKRIDWFATMPPPELAVIADKLNTQSFAPDDILFEKGDPGHAFYIIVRGWVSSFVNTEAANLIILNQFGPGDIFGEMALLDEKSRSSGIMALTPLEVLTLNRTEFLEVLQTHAPIALETLRSLTGKLRFASTYLEKAIIWSQRIADGDYSMVLDQIETSQHEVVGATESDDFRVSALLSAFFKLIQGVQQREDELRQEISQLKLMIKIDEEKRQAEVQAITEDPFFDSLKAQAQKIRREKKRGKKRGDATRKRRPPADKQ